MSYAPKPVDLKAGEEFHWLHNPAIAFTPQTDETRFICTCGATKNAPFCDGITSRDWGGTPIGFQPLCGREQLDQNL
jgi:hypothetical protein